MQINFFKNKKTINKKTLAPSPGFYWKIIMFFVFLMTVAAFAFGYYMFNITQQDPSISNEGTNKKQPVEKERIQKALDVFNNREKKTNEVINTQSLVVDPSL